MQIDLWGPHNAEPTISTPFSDSGDSIYNYLTIIFVYDN